MACARYAQGRLSACDFIGHRLPRPPDPFRADRLPFQCAGQRASCHCAATAQVRACHIRPLQASDRPAAPNSCDDATQPWSSPYPNPLTLAVVAWVVDARSVTHAGYGTLTDAGGYGNPVPLLIGVSALMSFSTYMHGVYSCGGVICTVV